MLGRLNVAKQLARQNSLTGDGIRNLDCLVEMLKSGDAESATDIRMDGQIGQEALFCAVLQRLSAVGHVGAGAQWLVVGAGRVARSLSKSVLWTHDDDDDDDIDQLGHFTFHWSLNAPNKHLPSCNVQGVPRLLVKMVEALRRRGLCMEGIYRVPGRASKIQAIMQLANSNVSELCDRLVWDEDAFDGRAISSAIKLYLATMPVRLLNPHMFASFVASTAMGRALERGGRSLRTPVGLASALCQLRTALVKTFGCPGNSKSEDRERGWRLATLDFVMRHFREVVALQATNRMSPRALALCLAPSLFGSTENAETNSQVLELLIEHWPWLSECLHRGSQLVSADRLGEPVSDACLYACRFRGATYADRNNIRFCFSLWRYALELQRVFLEPLCHVSQSSFLSFAELFHIILCNSYIGLPAVGLDPTLIVDCIELSVDNIER
nr:unnamed protein product [Spirometra erinaceieuropaei]